MEISKRHLIGIDQALGVGCTLDLGGKEYTFSPLTFLDYGKVVAFNKSIGLGAYHDAMEGKRNPTRQRDINAILCRGTKKEDFELDNISALGAKCLRSLLREHPKMTMEEVDKLLTVDAFRERICEVLGIVSEGPLEFTDKPREDGDADENPTQD